MQNKLQLEFFIYGTDEKMEVEISRSMTSTKLISTINNLINNINLYMTQKLCFSSDHIFVILKNTFVNIRDFYVHSLENIEKDRLAVVFTDLNVSHNKDIQNLILRQLGFENKPNRNNLLKESKTDFQTKSTEPDSEESFFGIYNIKEVGIRSKRGLDRENIYDVSGFTLPFSFATGNIKDEDNMPSPLYLSPEYIEKNYNSRKYVRRENLLKEFKIDDKHQLVLVDKDIKKRFKGLAKDMVGRITKMLFQGKNLVTISLPTKILAKMPQNVYGATLFTSIDLFHKATKTKDPIERLKYVITPFLSNFYYGANPLKPFNPYLGETVQAYFQDGSKIYYEHIQHSPPIDAFLVINEEAGFRIHGVIKAVSKIKFNEIRLFPKGVITVEIGSDKIYVEFGNLNISGFMFASLKFKIENLFYFYYPKAKLKAFVNVGPNGKIKKENSLSGGILRENRDVKFDKETLSPYLFPKMTKQKLLKLNEGFLSRIEGSWLDRISFDGVDFWNNKDPGFQLNLELNPIPSDWRFREDLLWCLYGNLKLADAWKYKLESIQREYRKKRQNFAKKARF